MEHDPITDLNPADKERGLRRNRKSYATRILEWYQLGDRADELTPAEELVKERLIMAWSNLTKGYPNQAVTKMVAKRFDITLRQAQLDVKDAMMVFGDVKKADKQGRREVASEMALRLWRHGVKNDDATAMEKGLTLYIKVHQLDKDNPEMPDFSKLESHLYAYVLDEASKKALEMITAQGGSINLSKIYDQMATEVEVEAEDADDE